MVPSPDILLQDPSYLRVLRAPRATEVTQVLAWTVLPCDPRERVARLNKSEVFYLATLWKCCEFFSESSAYEIQIFQLLLRASE